MSQLIRTAPRIVVLACIAVGLVACQVHADPYVPATYNVTALVGIDSAGFDSSGNVIAQLSPTLSATYVTLGPNAGYFQQYSTPFTPPSFNPGPLPGGVTSVVTASNSAGQEIGFSATANGNQTAFLYSGGQLTPISSFNGMPITTLQAINDSGQFTGSVTVPGGTTHAFLDTSGTMVDLGTLGGTTSLGENLNNLGQVVGLAATGTGWNDAFVYENGKMYDLNNLLAKSYPNLSLIGAYAINDMGQIIARDGNTGGLYLLTPSDLPAPPTTIPEPSTWMFFGLVIFTACVKQMLGQPISTGTRRLGIPRRQLSKARGRMYVLQSRTYY
jgi:probable HAF family extracellular repeat protein